MSQCHQQQNLKDCNCTYTGCPRKGFCCQCLKYHKNKKQLPACYFSASAERTYDRSFQNFIKDQKGYYN